MDIYYLGFEVLTFPILAKSINQNNQTIFMQR